MVSINEIKNRLPDEFVQNIYDMFSPIVVDNILRGIGSDRNTTLRVNTIKYNILDLMGYLKKENIKFDRVPWYKDALIIKNANEKKLKKLDIFKKGYIYLQSLSSMVPPLVLNPVNGDRVLDLTAAPGSKTTQMAAIMGNEGFILANEIDKIRFERLKFNVETQGAGIVEVVNGRGEKLGEKYENYFDKVLLDAPCSGEGRFLIKDVKTYRGWSIKEVKKLYNMQKKLIESGYKALKDGGTMVYSTCTLNNEENELVLDWAIKNLNLKTIDIDIEIREAMPAFNNNVDQSIKKAIRLLPSKDMEGFFVCKLRKL